MDIILIIIVGVLFLIGSANKKKREQAAREAKARSMQPQSIDPRFPSDSPRQDTQTPTFYGDAFPGTEGEPIQELPVNPAPAAQRVQKYESNTQTEGGPPAKGSAVMPTATVAAHLEATKGRRATLESGANIHAHIEGTMEGHHPAARKPERYGSVQPQDRPFIVPDILNRLGHDPNAVAEGVILSEILGKPKALRRV